MAGALPRRPPSTKSLIRPKRMESWDTNPLPWNQFFTREHWYKNPLKRIGNFHAFSSGSPGKPCILLIHGGGYSALSWAVLAKYMNSIMGLDVELLAIDLRAHGETDADETDLSLDTLSEDIMAVLHEHFVRHNNGKWEEIHLVGHSLGGAIAVDVAHKLPKIQSLTVLDVCESVAKQSLSGMKTFLRGRPQHFPTIQSAILWMVNRKTITNLESARVSIPGMFKVAKSNTLAAKECNNGPTTAVVGAPNPGQIPSLGMAAVMEEPVISSRHAPLVDQLDESLKEELSSPSGNLSKSPTFRSSPSGVQETNSDGSDDEEAEDLNLKHNPTQIMQDAMRYTWRTDLMKTDPFWDGWYDNLTEKFLSVDTSAKFVMMADSPSNFDRDNALVTAYMGGKLRMKVVANSGHMMHENLPTVVGDNIFQLLKHHRFVIDPHGAPDPTP